MPICRYFTQGKCRYGSECTQEHPGASRGGGGGGRQRGAGGQRHENSGGREQRREPAGRTEASPEIKPADAIIHDLSVDMQWPLSCYGLNTSWATGDNIIKGDYSPEELRCEAYARMRSVGNLNDYLAILNREVAEKRSSIATFLRDPMRAVAIGRTPRNVMTPSLPQSDSTPRVEQSPTTSLLGVMPTPNHPSHSQSQAGHDDTLYKNFTLGSIPELPPS